MDINEIEQKVRNIIETELGVEDVQQDSNLSQMGVDSLDLFELAIVIEEKFNIRIPDEDIYKLTSVAAITSYIGRLTCV